jgi:hypothetical protein
MFVAAAFAALAVPALASLEPARADGLRPIDAMSIDVGEVSSPSERARWIDAEGSPVQADRN